MYNYNPLPNQQWQNMVYTGIYNSGYFEHLNGINNSFTILGYVQLTM